MSGSRRLLLALGFVWMNSQADPVSSAHYRGLSFAQTTSNLTVGPYVRGLLHPNRKIIARAFPLGCQFRNYGKGFVLSSQLEVDDLQLAAFYVLWLRGLPCTIDWYCTGLLCTAASRASEV